MRHNLDFYRKVLFQPPDIRYMMAGVVLFGCFAGVVSTIALSPSSSIGMNILGASLVALFFYIVPGFLAAEIPARITGITPYWTYTMALASQLTVMLFSVIIPFADTVTEAWQIMWLGLATVYFIDLVMVVMANGRSRRTLPLTILYPLIYPGFVLLAFHLFIGRLVGIPRVLYLQNMVFFLASAFLLGLTTWIYTFIIRVNVPMSSLDFFSTLITDEEKALDLGVDVDVPHQALHVDSGERHTFTVPWVHPGPIEGFGGGRLTSELIDADTFLLHVPSAHSLDLADPADIDRFVDAPDAELRGEATRLLSVERGGFTLYGRRYAGGTVVTIDNRKIDDYDPGIAADIKKKHPDICLIDLHNQPRWGEKEPWLEHLDGAVDDLNDGVDELMDELADAEMHPYRAGVGGTDGYRALVEEVDGQRTCLVGIDGNDAIPALLELEDVLDHDHVLTFTTDSHEHVLELASATKYRREDLEDAVADADDALAPAEAGIGERTVEGVRILGNDYQGMMATINIMARMVPISLILYYIGIVFLVF